MTVHSGSRNAEPQRELAVDERRDRRRVLEELVADCQDGCDLLDRLIERRDAERRVRLQATFCHACRGRRRRALNRVADRIARRLARAHQVLEDQRPEQLADHPRRDLGDRDEPATGTHDSSRTRPSVLWRGWLRGAQPGIVLFPS